MTLTVLHSQFGPLAKIWQPDGTILGYSSGQHYTLDQRSPQNLDDLATHLSLLEYDTTQVGFLITEHSLIYCCVYRILFKINFIFHSLSLLYAQAVRHSQ